MCLKPIYIAHPSKDFLHTDATKLGVSCGECLECRQHKKNEWYVRISQQLLACPPDKYIRGFLTLTFNDDYLPSATLVDSNGEEHTFMCFDNTLVRSFFKKLRKRLHRLYGISDLRWIACPEYGEHTHRSHYHIIIIVPRNGKGGEKGDRLSVAGLYDLFHLYWSNKYGFIAPSEPFVRTKEADYYFEISDAVASARYTSKYCTKEPAFYEIPEVSKLVSTYKEFRKYEQTDPVMRDWCVNYRRIMPRVITSTRFGACIDENITNSDDPLQEYLKGLLDATPDHRPLQFPSYTYRRLMKKARRIQIDGEYKIRYYNTPLYKEVRRISYPQRVTNLTEIYDSFFTGRIANYRDFHKSLSDAEKADLASLASIFISPNTPHTFRTLAVYSIAFRNHINNSASRVLSSTFTPDKFVFPQNAPLNDVISCALDYYMLNIDFQRKVNEQNAPQLYGKEDLFNSLDCFSLYESALSYFERYQEQERPKVYRAKGIKFAYENFIKSAFKNGKIRESYTTFEDWKNSKHFPAYLKQDVSRETSEDNNIPTSGMYRNVNFSDERLYKYAKMRNNALRTRSTEFRIPTEPDFIIDDVVKRYFANQKIKTRIIDLSKETPF